MDIQEAKRTLKDELTCRPLGDKNLLDAIRVLLGSLDMKNKTIYRSEVKITKEFINDVAITKEVMERDFIIKFLTEIPFDKLKELVNFKELDYENQDLCNESIDNYDYYLQEKIKYLQSLRAIEFNATITI